MRGFYMVLILISLRKISEGFLINGVRKGVLRTRRNCLAEKSPRSQKSSAKILKTKTISVNEIELVSARTAEENESLESNGTSPVKKKRAPRKKKIDENVEVVSSVDGETDSSNEVTITSEDIIDDKVKVNEREEKIEVVKPMRKSRIFKAKLKIGEAVETSSVTNINVSGEGMYKSFEELDELELLMEEGAAILEESEKKLGASSTKIEPSEKFEVSVSSSGEFDQEVFQAIQKLVDMRTLARRNLDYATADEIKERLGIEYQVEIRDRLGFWTAQNGQIRGPIVAEPEDGSIRTPCQLTPEEVNDLVTKRTAARRNRDYGLADSIRQELTKKGIELIDRENIWRAFDRSISGAQSSDFESFKRKRYGGDYNDEY